MMMMATELALQLPPHVIDVCRSFVTHEECAKWHEQQQQQQQQHHNNDDDDDADDSRVSEHAGLQLLMDTVCHFDAIEVDTLVCDANGCDALDDTTSSAQYIDGGDLMGAADCIAANEQLINDLTSDLFDTSVSPLSDNDDDDDDDDDDDREFRADAATMRVQALDLPAGLATLLVDLADDNTESFAASEPSLSTPLSSPSSASTAHIDALLALQLPTPSPPPQSALTNENHDAVETQCDQPLTHELAAPCESPRSAGTEDVEYEAAVASASPTYPIDACAHDSDVVDEQQMDAASHVHAQLTRSWSSVLPFGVGATVEANFLGLGTFHRGRIVKVHGKFDADILYDVAYIAFDETETRVAPSCVRACSTAKSAVKNDASAVSARKPRPSTAAKTPRSHSRASARDVTSASSKRDTTAATANVAPPVVPLLPTVAPVKRVSLKSARFDSAKPIATAKRAPTSRVNNSSNSSAPSTAISWRELEEWRNVDAILSHKRRVVHTQRGGGVESANVPWGEAFAAIQSLKRFATQHPDVLRAHISSQLETVGTVKRQTNRAPSLLSPAVAASRAREALLLVKDLAFLLQQRLAPFLDVIVPVVLPAVFNTEKRFLCDTAFDVLEALVTHCSGRRLALLLLQVGDASAQRDDTRLLNLTSVYVEKCFAHLNAVEIDALLTRPSAGAIVTMLANLLVGKAAPSKIAAQKTFVRIHTALRDVAFERIVRELLPDELASVVLRLTVVSTSSTNESGLASPTRSPTKSNGGIASPVVVYQGMSILQRMVVQRQNRVVPAPE